MHSCVYVYICGCMHTWTSKDNWVGQSLSTFHILSVIDLGLCHVGQAVSFHASAVAMWQHHWDDRLGWL